RVRRGFRASRGGDLAGAVRRRMVTAALADPHRLEAHVRMLSETLAPRDEAHPANLDRAAAYIARELTAAGAAVREQPYAVDGRTFRNVVRRVGPAAGEHIVVGAHYDTCRAWATSSSLRAVCPTSASCAR